MLTHSSGLLLGEARAFIDPVGSDIIAETAVVPTTAGLLQFIAKTSTCLVLMLRQPVTFRDETRMLTAASHLN